MYSNADIEQDILNNLRQLTADKQQEVLDFTEFLRQKNAATATNTKLSLREIAALPLAQRHQYIMPYIPATAQDFLTDPELTEFAVLDVEGWENEHD
jgi:Protein of unknown function (DUF2281)